MLCLLLNDHKLKSHIWKISSLRHLKITSIIETDTPDSEGEKKETTCFRDPLLDTYLRYTVPWKFFEIKQLLKLIMIISVLAGNAASFREWPIGFPILNSHFIEKP